jgi:hypothetical protein
MFVSEFPHFIVKKLFINEAGVINKFDVRIFALTVKYVMIWLEYPLTTPFSDRGVVLNSDYFKVKNH